MAAAGPRVAVLGAGIMGTCLALYLTRRGARVTLFDQAAQPMAAASRWNEGKIHLGFLYNADPTLKTARHMLPGGLLFRPLVEDLIGRDLAPVISAQDDLYLCHRDSVVAPEAMEAYLREVTGMLRAHPDARHYLADAREARSTRLGAAELASVSGSPEIVAGFRVPERSVETTWVAERFVEALAAEPRIEQRMNCRVTAVAAPKGNDGPWRVASDAGDVEGFDFVVNVLWQGRMEIDRTAGIAPAGVWSNRFRQSLFLRTREPVETPCALIATGPFGDVKNYNDRDFYLSWYPAGLLIDSDAVVPPADERLERPPPEAFADRVFDNLESFLPWIADLREKAERCRAEGGWVFAAGRGALSRPDSTLHRRADYGVVQKGRYLSIDTGKYSTAPWLARSVAEGLF